MSTKYADDPSTEAAKKQLAEEQKATEKSRADFAERTKGKPTPTQEENDMAMLGARILEHEADGSDPDPHNVPHGTAKKDMEADKSTHKPQSYSTKETTKTHHG